MNLFDVIHSIDREKLIVKISNEAQNLGFCPDLFIQVNTGNETQKAGVKKEEVTKLLELAKLHSLPVIGLMCLPPINELPSDHFKILNRKYLISKSRDLFKMGQQQTASKVPTVNP